MAMSCEPYREAVSAQLDGEASGMSDAVLDGHLKRCPDCTAWLAAATRAGRLLRVSSETPPDLSEQVLRSAGLPAARLSRRRRLIRSCLGVLALLQWALAVPELWGQDLGMPAAMAVDAHRAHESAAWNVALGAALLAVALRPARAAGTLPILSAFVAMLTVLSVPDLLGGEVTGARLASHAGVVLAVLLIAVLARAERLPQPSGELAQPDRHRSVRPAPRRSRGAA
jgi:predicted anti-sigma-YlaC factor YlaD